VLVLIGSTVQIGLTLGIVGAMVLVYAVIEPRLKKLIFRDLFACFSAVLVTTPTISGMLSLLLRSRQSLWSLLTTEPINGGHVYTYASIAVVYLVSFYAWHDGFYATLSAILYPALHESVWYMIYYSHNQWTAPIFAGDGTYVIWIATAVFLYAYKHYPKTKELSIGVVLMIGYQFARTTRFGFLPKANPTEVYLELGSWMLFFIAYLLHLRRVRSMRK
jgi:hypothetical protein